MAPVLGGYLTEAFGWRSSYLFLALFGIAVVITMMTSMMETLPKERRKNESVVTSYKFVLSDKRFQGFLLVLVATFAGIAVFEAAAIRLRPILMTTIATVLCAMPLALATGAGAESRYAMSIVVLGGIALSSLITLYLIPALYKFIENKKV